MVLLLHTSNGLSHLAPKSQMNGMVNSFHLDRLRCRRLHYLHKRLSRWFIRAHPFNVKVNKLLKQVSEFVIKKANTICGFCMVVYAYLSVMHFHVS